MQFSITENLNVFYHQKSMGNLKIKKENNKLKTVWENLCY